MKIDSHKEATYKMQVKEYDADITDEYVYPVRCGACRSGEVIVTPGQYVRAGQKIIEAGKVISACHHASVSGKVVAIEPRDIIGEKDLLSVVIKNDRKYEEYRYENAQGDKLYNLTRQQIIDIIKNSGIIGMGGAGFPAHIKYMVKDAEKIKYIIANAAECEPYITSDYRLINERMEEVRGGLRILKHIFPNARLMIADGTGIMQVTGDIEDNNSNMEEGSEEEGKLSGYCRLIREYKQPGLCDYPHGAEKQLVYEVTGYKLKENELPVHAACIVNNVHTISAVYNAVYRGIPSIKRIVTVTGEGVKSPGNYLIRIGADIRDIINVCGGLKNDRVTVIAGGPMMGTAINSLHVPVLKTTSGIVCLRDSGFKKHMTACIRCGRCIQACPCRLMPFMENADEENEIKNNSRCIGCGCCSYVCPAGRELTLSMSGRMKKQKG